MATPAVDLRDDSGYILPTTALLLVPIMIFVALAVDVGGWTVNANRVQAAADAGALAAAAWLPDQVKATDAAVELATANGYTSGVDGVTVSVTFPQTTKVRVTITAPADRFFSTVVDDDTLNITRYAEATSLSPVGMGSPTNVLGFGPYSLDGTQPANYWLLENNDCSPAHYGDLKAAKYLASPWCGDGLSLPENPNWKRRTEGRDGGYFYVVTVPPGLNATSTLMIFDPGKCAAYGSKPADARWNRADNQGTRMEWRSWDTGGTPLIFTDDTPSSAWWGSDECASDLPYPAGSWTDQTQGWTTTPFTFPANSSGEDETYLVQTRVLDSVRQGWNYHALWVRPNNGTTSCVSIGSTTCPTISAEQWIATGARGAAVGDAMDLFMAEVGPEHAGRTMNVSIWDAGEGMDNIKIIDPAGNVLDFTWETDDPSYGTSNPSDTCSGDPCLWLDPARSNYPPKFSSPGWGNHHRFNGRIVTLSVPLDSQIDWAAYPPSGLGYWFRLRFEPIPSKTATEWATFSVQLTGDPIRLTY